jgi:hypothetical protein
MFSFGLYAGWAPCFSARSSPTENCAPLAIGLVRSTSWLLSETPCFASAYSTADMRGEENVWYYSAPLPPLNTPIFLIRPILPRESWVVIVGGPRVPDSFVGGEPFGVVYQRLEELRIGEAAGEFKALWAWEGLVVFA